MSENARIAIGCDPNAAELKKELIAELEELGYTYKDYGAEDPIYANTAISVAEAVASGKHERGVVICGTGIGVSIAANKVAGAYAALVSDAYSAERAAKSNNANIIAMGAQTMGTQLGRTLLRIWLNSAYTPGGRSQPKIDRIYEYEREHVTDGSPVS